MRNGFLANFSMCSGSHSAKTEALLDKVDLAFEKVSRIGNVDISAPNVEARLTEIQSSLSYWMRARK